MCPPVDAFLGPSSKGLRPVRPGGFVIHDSAADTLGPCLDDLCAVRDEVVAVDSGPTDGSLELARARGVRVIAQPREGFGAARVIAARELSHCDYLFFLDSDERLAAHGAEKILAWKNSAPTRACYRVQRHDWAELADRRFLFRSE